MMQLKDLVKPLDQQTDEELLERLRTVRHNREVARPVARRKAAKAEKKASTTRLSSAEKMLAGLSMEEQAELLKQLETTNGDAR